MSLSLKMPSEKTYSDRLIKKNVVTILIFLRMHLLLERPEPFIKKEKSICYLKRTKIWLLKYQVYDWQ